MSGCAASHHGPQRKQRSETAAKTNRLREPLRRNACPGLAAGDCIPSPTAANSIGVPQPTQLGDRSSAQATLHRSTVNSLPKDTLSPERVSFDRRCVRPQKTTPKRPSLPCDGRRENSPQTPSGQRPVSPFVGRMCPAPPVAPARVVSAFPRLRPTTLAAPAARVPAPTEGPLPELVPLNHAADRRAPGNHPRQHNSFLH